MQKRQREVSMAWIEMAKVLKALRVKQELCKFNMFYMQQRWAIRKWHSRTQRTLLLRRRDDQVIAKYHSKSLQ